MPCIRHAHFPVLLVKRQNKNLLKKYKNDCRIANQRSIPISNPSLPPPTCAEPCGKMCADHPGEYFCSARQVFVDTDERKLEPKPGMVGRYVHARGQASQFAVRFEPR